MRKLSPVDIIAEAIRASLLASATATTRSGFPRPHRDDPIGEGALGFVGDQHGGAAHHQHSCADSRLPVLVTPPSLSLPPLEHWLGVNPREAAKSLADRNKPGSGGAATIAEGIGRPKAGISS